MTIDQRPSGSAIVLDVDGRMTIETVNDRPLAVNVRRLLQEGQRRILLNLKGVPYLDTTGLRDIVEAYVATRRQGGSLKLLHPTAHVRAVLATTRLLTILETYDSESDAIASFGPSGSQPSNTRSTAGPLSMD
jgi:anti-sigma B factor antagonist